MYFLNVGVSVHVRMRVRACACGRVCVCAFKSSSTIPMAKSVSLPQPQLLSEISLSLPSRLAMKMDRPSRQHYIALWLFLLMLCCERTLKSLSLLCHGMFCPSSPRLDFWKEGYWNGQDLTKINHLLYRAGIPALDYGKKEAKNTRATASGHSVGVGEVNGWEIQSESE